MVRAGYWAAMAGATPMTSSEPRTASSSMRQTALRETLLNLWGRARSLGSWLSFRSRRQVGAGTGCAGGDFSQNVVTGQGAEFGLPVRLSGDAVSLARELHELTSGGTTLTYVIDKPYRVVLKQLRVALKARGFDIPVEMDVSAWINTQLGVTLRPCTVLDVACPFLVLEAAIIDATAAAFLPLQVIVTEAGSRSLVRLVPRTDGALTAGLRAQFDKFFGGVLAVLRELGAQRTVRETVL